ncbi:glycosyltransferase family 2 protein [Thiohalorhabdus denitrificans]|nr:glycosyltransferase family A protein [Thiohalorhabdus denitrificans]
MNIYPEQTLVSVVITSFNSSPETLARAIQSVLDQSYRALEVLVVDDGSSLPFGGVEGNFSEEHIRWIGLITNHGVGAARNVGLEAAEGEYVAFLDHDDWWEFEKVEKQVALLEGSQMEWVYCGITRHEGQNRSRTVLPTVSGDVSTDILKNQVIVGSVSTVMASKSLLQSVGGFSESRVLIEDWDLWIRVGAVSPVSFVSEPLVHLGRVVGKSRSQNVEGRLGRLAGLMRAHEQRYRDAGLSRYMHARYRRVEGMLYQQANDFPRCIKAWAKIALSFPGLLPKRGMVVCFGKTLPSWIARKSRSLLLTRPGGS